MPVGSVGELVIEGPTVARGYLNDEVKTAQAFIANPAWAASLPSGEGLFKTSRMYKSGDLVRYNSDGSISYIGRKDTQIKLNGQRIELGEIEFHVAKNFPHNVQSAVELVASSTRGSAKALAVFFAFSQDQSTESLDTPQPMVTHPPAGDKLLLAMSDNIRDICKKAENGLAGTLPSYMIPSIFIPVTKMPWTSAGKLNRNRLRNLVQDLNRETMASYRLTSALNKKQPTTEAEKIIHKAVCLVLNLPASSVGIDDNFVVSSALSSTCIVATDKTQRLGGDSISAMRLVSAAQTEKLELSFIDIFKNPRLADLAAIGASVSRLNTPDTLQSFALLDQSLISSGVLNEVSEQCGIPEKLIQDVYPTSPLQEALITLSVKQAGAYVAQYIFMLPSTVDMNKFQAAWAKTIRETDILRTRIVQLRSGEFLQTVLSDASIDWRENSSLQEAEKETLQIPSHFGGALASYTLVHTQADQRYFVWTLHHSLYDGWSIYLMLQRVQQIYSEGSSKAPQAPYTRFIKYLKDTNSDESIAFWKKSLAEAASYQFPQQPRSESGESPRGQTAQITIKFEPNRNNDVTPSNTIRAAWALLLASYTGSDDVIFGETLAGRDIAVTGITDICGPTLTTVPTRIKIDREATVTAFLKAISTSVTDRIPFQHLGLSEIRRIGGEMAVACDFQNLLVVQTANEELSDSMWSVYDNGEQSNFFTYPLVVECKMGKSRTDILVHHDANVISAWEVQRILYQFESVLLQLNSVSHVRDIRVFSRQDKELVRKWNGYDPVVIDETIPSLFFKQVALQPDAIAISAFDGDLTYAELCDLASQLAQELVRRGAGPERMFPICLDKSRWAIVAIMAVLIAGAAYVPVSPEYPVSRLRQIIDACKASGVLCSTSYEGLFVELTDWVFAITEKSIRSLPPCNTPLPLQVKSHNACYVIFTSGSTGVPKGVVMEHRSIASSSAAICKGLHISPSSRVFQFCSYLFDVSVSETLTVLTCGATICIPSEEQRTTDLASAITSLEATWAFLTPSVASTLDGPEIVPTLKTLVAGGEAMTSEVVEKFSHGLQLENGYGPTEGAVFAVTNDQVSTQRDPTNIGHMLQSGRAWLTLPNNPNELAAVGAIAELCLEGPLLAREYLNDPERTAESFIENPDFLKEYFQGTQSRIYRTGDLAQYMKDGSIRYIGRKDNQVKLAGQRIELGEIEHHLQANDCIQQVVVQLPKSGPCKKKLTAILSFHSTPVDTADAHCPWHTLLVSPGIMSQINQVRDKLSDHVPTYMMPTVWIAVSRIPILASTKYDKKQVGAWLETMDDGTYQRLLELESRENPSQPATVAIKTLQKLWAKVLNISTSNVNTNRSWLSLGGDSITAMRLLAKCRNEGINLTLNQVLRAKSLAHLAESVSSTEGPHYEEEQTEISFQLSPIQRFYFQVNNIEKGTHFNQSSTVRLSRKIQPAVAKRAFDAIVGCHSMLRARFSQDGNGTWQQYLPANIADVYAFKVHDVTTTSATVGLISSTQKSLNIVDGPVFAVDLFNVETGEQILFIAAHHLVIDVVSWGIILGDLEDCLASRSVPNLQRGLPFQKWCEKQQLHTLEGHQVEAMKKLPLAVEPIKLDFWGMDKRRNTYGDVERDEFIIDKTVSAMALDNHDALRTDVVDVLIAAIIHSFSRVFISRTPPTVFNESHGRETWRSSNLDLSRTVGWFTTLYPITVPISEDEDDVVHTIRQVKDNRRRVAENGRPYFAHRFLTDHGEQQYSEHAPMEVLFNYLGRQQKHDTKDSFFMPVNFSEDEEEETTDVGIETSRMALFEISASVTGGCIQLVFMYNRWMKNQKGIRRWIAECQRTIEEIASNLAKIDTPQPTIADFPLLSLESYSRLNRVLKALPSVGISSYGQVEDIYPCSSIQDGMILSQIKNPESYWSSTAFEIKSRQDAIDATKVAEAWKMVVNRHPALRTVFVDSVCKGGVFDQIVVKNVDTGLVTYTCDDSELTAKLNSIRHSDLNGKKKPCLPHQAAVIRTSSGKIIVKIIVNHTVIDGGSLAIIGRDLQEAYQGHLSDETGPLYSDYIKYLQSLPAEDAIEYWKMKLRGVQPCHFPTALPNITRQRQLRSLDMNFTQFREIHALAESSNVTFANILLASWAFVMRTYTNSPDVCYGYLTSGRNIPVDNVENAVGAFINMLVSRVEIPASAKMCDIIDKVKSDFIDSMPHQHCSLAQFQHDLGLSGKALFNTAVSIQNRVNNGDTAQGVADIEFEQLDGYDPSEFAITVNIDATRDDEAVRFTYWSDIVTDGDAKNVAALMAKILSQLLANSKQTVAELDAKVQIKPVQNNKTHLALPKSRPSILRSRSSTSNSSTSPPRTSRIMFPDLAPAPSLPPDTPDWSSLIRSIVSEMVPQIVEQIVAKNKTGADPAYATIDQMTSQMTGMLTRRASQSLHGRPNLETGSIRGSVRSRRMSMASDTENRIQTAADMVAAVGVLATEASTSIRPDFVEKKLLGLWSELLEMVEETIEKDDSFFVSS